MTRCIAVFRAKALAVPVLAGLLIALAGFAIYAESVSAYDEGHETSVGAGQVLPQEAEPEEDDDPEANLPYLFAVFIITWAAFFGYLFVMSRRQNELRQEIDALKERLADTEAVTPTRAD